MTLFFTAGWTSGIVGLAMKALGVARVLGGDSATADFTGDGIPDILLTFCQNIYDAAAFSGPAPGRLLLLKGKGDGSFLDGSVLLSGGGKLNPGCVRHLQTGDFNGDRKTDFVTASNYEDGRSYSDDTTLAAPQTAYLSSNGTLVRTALGLTTWAHALSVGDWNNDGRDDIFIDGFTPPPGQAYGTAVFVQNSSGVLVRRFLPIPGSGVASIADLDGNGVSELVEYTNGDIDPNQSGIRVTSIQGDGSLGSHVFYPEPYDRIEACVAYNGSASQCTITHDANGEFIDGGINGFVIGDVNHDGHDDILNDRTRTKMVYVDGVLDTRGAPATTVLQVRTLGPGGVLPIPATRITGWTAPVFVPYFRFVDFNGDGHLDIFAPTDQLDGHVNQILLNDGVGNFRGIPGAYIPQITPYPAYGNSFFAEPIDANRDGIMDLVLRLTLFQPADNPLPSASTVTYLATKRFFTGLGYANPALRGVPGFNDDYYLNAHPTVRTLIAQHTYVDALDHYVKAGKALGWQPFAVDTTVYGSDGPDFVRLRGGNETAVSSPGRDFYQGGAGRDTFVFNKVTDTGNTSLTRDVIMDFAPHTDKLDLHGIDARTTVAGNQAFTFLPVANTIFHHIAGELRWRLENPINTVNDKTIIEGDTNGDGIADLQIELRGLMNVFASDLVL